MGEATNSRNVSVLGLGLMGSALAEALVNAGHRVTVWNRTAAKADPISAKGASVASSVSDAIDEAEVTLVCVTGHEATMALLRGIPVPATKKTLVQLSTMSADESRELARWAEAQGMRYLDGSILGLPSTVVSGQATLIYSGPKDLFEVNEPLLAALGAAKHLSTEIGAAVAFDRVWYAFVYAALMAFMQGAAMAHKLGFSLDVYFDIVKARSPIVIDQCLTRGKKISAQSYDTSDARIDIWADAFEDTLLICRDKGVDDSLPTVVLNHLRRASASSYGDSDIAAVFEVLINPGLGDPGKA